MKKRGHFSSEEGEKKGDYLLLTVQKRKKKKKSSFPLHTEVRIGMHKYFQGRAFSFSLNLSLSLSSIIKAVSFLFVLGFSFLLSKKFLLSLLSSLQCEKGVAVIGVGCVKGYMPLLIIPFNSNSNFQNHYYNCHDFRNLYFS